MKHYLGRRRQEKGDFSTPFADMVFGLLFIFFLLTLAMVFQRPEVRDFQEKLDQMLKEVQKKDQKIAEWARKHESLTDALKKADRQKKESFSREAGFQQENQVIRKEIEVLMREIESLQTDLEGFKAKYQKLLSEYKVFRKTQAQREATFKQNLSKLKRKFKQNLSKLKRENRDLLENHIKLTEKQKRFIEENGLLKIEVDVFRKMLDKIKALLKKNGHTKILADVQKMEKNKKEAEKKAKSGDDILFNDFLLTFEYYPDGEIVNAELWEGEKKVQSYPTLFENDVLSLSEEMNLKYSETSAYYTDIEKNLHRPKILLKVHPDTSYGDLQKFLMTIRKFIVVSLIPWEKRRL